MTARIDDPKIITPEDIDPGHDWSRALRAPWLKPSCCHAGMVFALESCCPASDGFSAARIEEEVVVTNDGCKVITLFPADELPVANPY